MNGYLNVDEAYTLLNEFRTSSDVWQWNEDNKTKTYFNKAGATQLVPLAADKGLEKTAKIRAKEIAKLFDHTRPNGELCFSAFPANCWAMGENIAGGQTSAKSATEDWKETNDKYNGQGHRRNMLSEEFNSVGIACYVSKGCHYWVQDFAYIGY